VVSTLEQSIRLLLSATATQADNTGCNLRRLVFLTGFFPRKRRGRLFDDRDVEIISRSRKLRILPQPKPLPGLYLLAPPSGLFDAHVASLLPDIHEAEGVGDLLRHHQGEDAVHLVHTPRIGWLGGHSEKVGCELETPSQERELDKGFSSVGLPAAAQQDTLCLFPAQKDWTC